MMGQVLCSRAAEKQLGVSFVILLQKICCEVERSKMFFLSLLVKNVVRNDCLFESHADPIIVRF